MTFLDLSRRDVLGGMKNAATVALASTAGAMLPNVARASRPPNVLFIAIDDLNDWIEPLGGYSGVQTPNLKRLAEKTRLFLSANTPAPVCSAARSAVLFGVEPWRSGVYTNNDNWEIGSRLVGQTSLPRFFRDNGYTTIGTGKIFHRGFMAEGSLGRANDPDAWSDFQYCQSDAEGCRFPKRGDREDEENDDDIDILGHNFRFGPSSLETAQTPDVVRTRWFARSVLGRRHDKPLFAAIGLQKPHLPFTPPQSFFDLYDKKALHYPPGVLDPDHNTVKTNEDVADLPPAAIAMLGQTGLRDHARIIDGGYWQDVVHAYLATITYTDYCVGLLLDAWLDGPNAADTIVVVWSDHGWQLGEKLAWRKFTLWERAARVPLFIGGSVGGRAIRPGETEHPVSTVSLFPTLAELVVGRRPSASELGGLPLEGESLKGHLLTGSAPSSPAVTAWMLNTGEGGGSNLARSRHFSVRTQRHRLIQYGDGGRELYDHANDPYEFRNLLAEPTANAEAVAADLRRAIPDPSVCVAPANRGGAGRVTEG